MDVVNLVLYGVRILASVVTIFALGMALYYSNKSSRELKELQRRQK